MAGSVISVLTQRAACNTLSPVLIGAALALMGCHEQLASAPAVLISVGIDSVSRPSALVDTSGQPFMQCTVGLTSVNPGPAPLRWIAGVLHIYPGGDTTIRGDSTDVLQNSIGALWGATDIQPGERRTAIWSLPAVGPYFAVMEFRYQDPAGGGTGTARVSFLCGPTSVGSWPSAPPPRIVAFAVAGPDTVKPNSYLYFNLALADTVGLWTALLHNTANCPEWDILLQWPGLPKTYSSVPGNLAMYIPLSCPAGTFTVTVTVRDAVWRQSVDTLTATVH